MGGQSDVEGFALPEATVTLEQALVLLTEAGAELSYRPDGLPDLIVDLPDTKLSLEQWLRLILRNTELIYERGAAGYLILVDPALRDRTYNFFGMVTDGRTGERLIGATVQLLDLQLGTHTNEYGFYTLAAPAGNRKVRVTYVGYTPLELDLLLRSDTLIDIKLRTNRELPQIIVTATGVQDDPNSYLETSTRIGRAEVSQLGGLGGEDDPLQLARLLPGVTSGADGIGGALIRGSEAGQNLILLDGVPVYGLSHAGGLFSIFNNQAIRRVDLYKDGLPARIGDRVGGVLDVHTRDGNLYENEFTVGTSLLSSQLSAEGPLVVGESSYLLTGRYFWAGPLIGHFSERYKERRGRQGRTDYNVYDFNFKVNQRVGKRGRLYLSIYRGLDDYTNTSTETQVIADSSTAGTEFLYSNIISRTEQARWGNTVGALRYNHIFSDRLFGNFRLSYSDLTTRSAFERSDSVNELINNIPTGEIFSGLYASEIRQFGLAFDGQYNAGGNAELRFGLEANRHFFNPQLLNAFVPLDTLRGWGADREKAPHRPVQFVGYGSLSGRYNKLHYRVGMRASIWNNGADRYYSFSPRLLLAGPVNKWLDWQLTYDRTVQPVHLLNSFVIGLPSDLWVPSSANIAPASAPQYAGKLKLRPGSGWNVESSVYYKRLNQLVAYAEGGQIELNWLENLSTGHGRAYGWETLVQRSRGKLRGWLSYTLARSDRTFDDRINQGRMFPFRYDRRHAVNLLLIYQLGDRTTLTGSWRYESGLAYSLSEAIIPDLEGEETEGAPYTSRRNGFRMPANHRLDLNLHSELSRADGKLTHSIDIGLYNVYSRHNPVYFDPRPESYIDELGELDSRTQFYQIFIAPLLPSLSYHLTFSGGRKPVFGR